MNYQQTLDFLFAQLPMYQRIGAAAYKKDLNNTLALCAALGSPEKSFKSIHVAGTNGKGSTSHMLASILQEAGYKTGLYTSPHLIDFRERIRVNGDMVSEEFVCQFVEKLTHEITTIKPSFFEITVAMAFDYFRAQKVDVAVVETGLGGRLDSTNVILPELSIITNIGYDHADMLGETLELIAGEKAGIIKPNTPVVVGEYQKEIQHIFEQKAKELSAPMIIAKDVDLAPYTTETELKGRYQSKNVRTVLAAIKTLVKGGWEIHANHVHAGLQRVVANTGLMGRWQQISTSPWVICDTGHNAEGMSEIVHQLTEETFNKLHIVFGQVAGKSPQKVLALLPKTARYYFCAPSIPRALQVEELFAEAQVCGLEGSMHHGVMEAYTHALQQADKDDLIFVGGSTFVVADLLSGIESIKQ